jgi:two-component system CheB/CheR fusion protein
MAKQPLKSGRSKASRTSKGEKNERKRVKPASPTPAQPFPVVGVGASAGGLEAFSRFLRALPVNTGMAFVFVQHLDPKHVSMLTDLLSRETRMPAREVQDGVRIAPNHIYVIPRDKSMELEGGKLRISPRTADYAHHLPIDVFFRSLAQERKSLAIGVVLSGNGSDGTLGLEAIKAAGGIAFAQDEVSAKSTGMPHSAAASGAVDFVLPPEQIALELTRIVSHPYVRPEAANGPDDGPLPDQDGSLAGILTLVRGLNRVDFTHYKESTIRRRILRRIMLHKIEGLKQYLAFLRHNPNEVENLYEDMLITVTEFFRDPEAFEGLQKILSKRLLARGSSPQTIRVWVPGCSTGEEVYSIAISLLELVSDRPNDTLIQMFATDISERALEKARAGIYPFEIRKRVSAERLRRFFVKLEDGYQVSKRVRDLCIFARQNVAQDPPFSRLDLISCRNVLIYLGAALHKRILPTLHYALKPRGLLMLGSSESVGAFTTLFHLEDRKSKIYLRREAVVRAGLEFGLRERALGRGEEKIKAVATGLAGLPKDVDRLILARYSPAGVVVNQDWEVLEFRGDTSSFLKNAPGAASLNLLKMAREGLMAALRTALNRAQKQRTAVRADRLPIRDGQRQKYFNLEVIPFTDSAAGQPRFLIIFEDPASKAGAVSQAAASEDQRDMAPRPGRKQAGAGRARVSALVEEMKVKDEHLRAVSEEYEAAIEELRSSNEEILSSNEELQSTNEELETAKEELQSANEEMNTLNEELRHRNDELTKTDNDLNNFLSSTNIPLVILSNDLRVRRYTPVSEKALNLLPSDVGRPIRDLNLNLRLDNLEELLAGVLERLAVAEVDVQDITGHWSSLRMRPYRTQDNHIDGVVLAMIDIDPLKRSIEEGVRKLAQSEGAVRTSFSGLISAQEEERRRLSHEIHDEVNQEFALLELDVDLLERHLPASPDETRQRLAGLRNKIAGLSDNLRGLAYRLHPSVLDDLGLTVALQSYCKDFSEREGIPVQFSAVGVPAALPEHVPACFYRTTQEALRNVAQHAHSSRVTVTLAASNGELSLSIRDDGVGLDPRDLKPGRGLGILGMQERAWLAGGAFMLHSEPGKGTEITVRAPCGSEAASG